VARSDDGAELLRRVIAVNLLPWRRHENAALRIAADGDL
jgi:hypothetical protein